MTQGSKGTIMIAEDAPPLRALYAAAFKAAGYTPMTVSNGLEALSLLTRVQPRVLLLDIAMPELDGIATCRRARLQVGPNLPVLFLTAADRMDILRECLAAGGNDFLVKTDNIDRIIARVDFWAANPARREALGRQHEIAESVSEPAPSVAAAAAPPSLADLPDLPRDEKRAEARRWIAAARAIAGLEFGKTREQHLVLIGYVAGLIDRQAGDDFGLKLSYSDDVMAALRAAGALDDAGFLALVDDWVTTLGTAAFAAGARAGQADFEVAREAPADQPPRLLGLGAALAGL